jgi:hypothetical protein
LQGDRGREGRSLLANSQTYPDHKTLEWVDSFSSIQKENDQRITDRSCIVARRLPA